MRFHTLAGALALAGSSTAFSDSRPWVLLSSSPFGDAPESKQIQTGTQVLDYTSAVLKTCATGRYLIVNQHGLTAADLRGPKGCGLPSLCHAAEDSRNKGKFVVPEVVGDISTSTADIVNEIKNACDDKGLGAIINELDLMSLSSDDRAGALSELDADLSPHFASATIDGDYTILFFSTSGEPAYAADFVEPFQMGQKRDVRDGATRRQSNQTDWDRLPLFQKYQFFTPGIFMGIIVALILIAILGVGLRALSSLEVSYGAFEKDMGPAAQKKQQ